jgi:LuxR family transcriptional regulator, maltose regulon positive regulatory protein
MPAVPLRSLAPPRLPPFVIRRARLTLNSADSLPARQILVHGPAGYGKTVLLTQAFNDLRESGQAVSWMSLSPHDNVPTVLAEKFILSVRAVLPQFGEAALGWIRLGSTLKTSALATLLTNEMHSHKASLRLFIDGLDNTNDVEARVLLNLILSSAPDDVQFTVSSRGDPLRILELQDETARDGVRVIGPWDLPFDRAESADVLGAMGAAIDGDDLSQILDCCEGWPAYFGLNARALCSHTPQNGPAGLIERTTHQANTYLKARVFEPESEEVRAFLVSTAMLDDMSPQLCDAVCASHGNGLLLQDVARRGLFCSAQDGRDEWYRYHGLFRRFLLGLSDSVAKRNGWIVATAWCAEHARPADAVRYALASGNRALFTQTLDDQALAIWNAGDYRTLIYYIEHLSRTELCILPKLACYRVLLLMVLWHVDDVRHTLAELQRSLDVGLVAHDQLIALEPNRSGTVADHLGLLSATFSVFSCDDPFSTFTRAKNWLTARPDSMSDWDAWMELVVASAEGGMLNFSELEVHIRRSNLFAKRRFSSHGYIWTGALTGLCFFESGNLGAAQTLFAEVLSLARRTTNAAGPSEYMCLLMQGAIQYQRDQLEAARQTFDRASAFEQVGGLPYALVFGLLAKARLRYLEGKLPLTMHDVREAQAIADIIDSDSLRAMIYSERIDLALRDGDTEAAVELLPELIAITSQDLSTPTPQITQIDFLKLVSKARVDLTLHRAKNAVSALELWVPPLTERVASVALIQVQLLLGAAYDQLRELAKSERCLREAIRLAVDTGGIRWFLDQLPLTLRWMSMLLPRLIMKDARQVAFVQALITRLTPGSSELSTLVDAEEGSPMTAEAFTRREIEILALINRGFSNQDVAVELRITLGTVKWYLQQIFNKLDVRQRSKAVYRARVLGLLN